MSPFSSVFCCHYTRVSCTSTVSFMFTVTRLLCIVNQQKICCAWTLVILLVQNGIDMTLCDVCDETNKAGLFHTCCVWGND